jgi:hypothetical protein
MTKRIIQVPVVLGIPKRKTDGSVKLEAVTSYEVSTDDYMLMDSYRQKTGWLMFSENEFSDDDVPKDNAPSDLKSPSLRLRDVLYVYFMKTHDDASQFSNFYNAALEKYITQVKEKLD